MEYKCKMINASRLNVGPNGFIFPICNSCKTKDCSNPIESMRVSIVGVVKNLRLYSRGNDSRIVVECEGFIGK